MDHTFKRLLQVAESTALLAGFELRNHRKQWAQIEAELGRDVKVTADRESEAIILENLQAATNFPILTEESGWQAGDDDEYTWVIDPLDGSFNYFNRIPACCVSIALVRNKEPILGVVYDFNHRELYSGIVGQGAWFNTQPMGVSVITNPAKGILYTGFPVHEECNDQNYVKFMRFASQWRKVRMIGSAALALSYVACGKAECFVERGTMFWDVAAGIALVRAAGGVVEMSCDALDQPINVTACNVSNIG